jgi:hypothetical protein
MRPCFCCNEYSNNTILDLDLQIINDIPLGNKINILFCENCNFYYSVSNSSQEDYNLYYLRFNNYTNYNNCIDKDQRCFQFLNNFFSKTGISNVIDYGSGNGDLSKLLSTNYSVEQYDIGMEKNTNQYECLILSHVLEHIHDLNQFINTIAENIKDNCYLYIEIPNAEFYSFFNDFCPLQEINLEHINFFSKYALNKLLLNNGFLCISMLDDHFLLNNSKYYVIRAIFQKKNINKSFLEYIENGKTIINNYNYKILSNYPKIYVYGCGQFLFKIIHNIRQYTTIINIVDDNTCYEGKQIDNIDIINSSILYNKIVANDVIIITSLVYSNKIKEKLQIVNTNITVLNISEL